MNLAHSRLNPIRLAVLCLLPLFAQPTWAEPNQDFSIAHLTDTHITSGGKFQKNLSNILSEISTASPKPAFVIVTGDQTEMGFTEEYEEFTSLTCSLAIPVYNVMGNHEAKWSNWGKTGASRFWKQDPYYSFSHNGVHFVGLDSSMWLEHHGLLGGKQLSWLKDDLKQTGTTQPVVLFFHHGPGFLGDENELIDAIRPYNVCLILVGHGHQFHTWKRDGITLQMTQAAMNAPGGYRILEFSKNSIRSYKKLAGSPAKLDEEIALKRQPSPLKLLSPTPQSLLESSFQIRAQWSATASNTTSAPSRLEYLIGETTGALASSGNGFYEGQLQWQGTPGWYTLKVRATDPSGMEWTQSACVRLQGASREAWRVQASGAIQAPVTLDSGRLFFGCLGGDVYCLEAKTGRVVWKHNVGADVLTQIAVQEATACAACGNGKLVALDASTGAPRWEYQTDGPLQGPPSLYQGKVFFGSGDCSFYALDAATGKLSWKLKTARMTQSRPLCQDNTVYFGCWDRHFYALDAQSGALRWKTQIGQLIYFSPANSHPACDGKRILVAATPWHAGDPDIFCLDTTTGAILWKRRNPGEKSQCAFNSPCVAASKDRFFIASLAGELFCMDTAQGKELWRAQTGQEAYDNSPVASGTSVYLGGLQGKVFAMNAATGQKLWSYSVGEGQLFASSTLGADLLFVPSMDGWLSALRLSTSR